MCIRDRLEAFLCSYRFVSFRCGYLGYVQRKDWSYYDIDGSCFRIFRLSIFDCDHWTKYVPKRRAGGSERNKQNIKAASSWVIAMNANKVLKQTSCWIRRLHAFFAHSRPIAVHIVPFHKNIGHSSHNNKLIVGRQFTSIENFHYIPYIDVEGFPLKPVSYTHLTLPTKRIV